MKIAYTTLNLDDDEQRGRLFDDLIVHVTGDETARQYLEDLQDWSQAISDEQSNCLENH